MATSLIVRDYERLLSYEQQVKYAAAINRGWFDNYHGLEWRHTFYGAFIWKYPKRLALVERFKKLLGHAPDWDDITDDNLRDLHDALTDAYAPNSVKTISAEICSVIRENKPSKNIPSEFFGKVMHSKKVPVHSVYLTRKEIEQIIDYQPHTTIQRYVKRIFLLECMTGARKSDCERMTPENIFERDGHKFLRYVSKKSNCEVTVPLDKRASEYLVPVSIVEPQPTTFSFNSALQTICKRCGIKERVKVFTAGKDASGQKWQFVSSHTGRRSFATNLAIKGVSLEQIALMMGHMSGNMPNITMTQHYIVGKMNLDARVIHLFE